MYDLLFQVFTATWMMWLLFELLLIAKNRRKDKTKDRGTERKMLLLIFAAIAVGIYVSKNYPSDLPGTRDQQMALGIGLMWLGISIRAWAISSLGRFFTTAVTIQEGHKVIRTGPYRYVRHPSYSGSLLAFIGAGIALGNLTGLLLMIALTFTAYYLRMNVEEKVLIAAFGEEYVRYMKETKRIVPFLY